MRKKKIERNGYWDRKTLRVEDIEDWKEIEKIRHEEKITLRREQVGEEDIIRKTNQEKDLKRQY